VACDEIVQLVEPLRPGAHQNGIRGGWRLGGGGANTAVALAGAGHDVTLLAAVGLDKEGETLIAELAAAGVTTSGIVRLAQPTTRSLILIDPSGERSVVNVARCEESEPPYRLNDLQGDAVYVRSRRTDLASLMETRLETGLVLAHVPPVATRARPAHMLLASTADLRADEIGDPFAMGQKVAGDQLRWVFLTAGPAGASAFSREGFLAVAAEAVNPLDTTGAGDAFAAGLIHALVCGEPTLNALQIAVKFGTRATLCRTSPLSADAVRKLLWYSSRRDE
jgi:sugar/nucleoside kinase (ribokinase family)